MPRPNLNLVKKLIAFSVEEVNWVLSKCKDNTFTNYIRTLVRKDMENKNEND